MTTLLTGCTGFLGKYILQRLARSSTIYTLGRSKGDLIIDLSRSVPTIKGIGKVDTVVHVAGKAHMIPKTVDEREMFWKVNFEGTRNLCTGLKKSGNLPTSFVFVSTVSVYGREVGNDITEEHSLHGTSDYARSKIAAEQWLKEWATTNDVKLLIFRLPLVVGYSPPGQLGAMIEAIRSGRYFRIGKGDTRRSMVLATDVAEIISRSIGKGGIYNLTDGCHPSWKELEELISFQLQRKPPLSIPLSLAKMAAIVGDLLGGKFPINSYRLSKIVSTLTFSDAKARQELDWSPQSVLHNFTIY